MFNTKKRCVLELYFEMRKLTIFAVFGCFFACFGDFLWFFETIVKFSQKKRIFCRKPAKFVIQWARHTAISSSPYSVPLLQVKFKNNKSIKLCLSLVFNQILPCYSPFFSCCDNYCIQLLCRCMLFVSEKSKLWNCVW